MSYSVPLASPRRHVPRLATSRGSPSPPPTLAAQRARSARSAGRRSRQRAADAPGAVARSAADPKKRESLERLTVDNVASMVTTRLGRANNTATSGSNRKVVNEKEKCMTYVN